VIDDRELADAGFRRGVHATYVVKPRKPG
jgi:hypothetical protein